MGRKTESLQLWFGYRSSEHMVVVTAPSLDASSLHDRVTVQLIPLSETGSEVQGAFCADVGGS